MRFATNRRAGLWLVVTALAATAALIAADRPDEQKTNEAPSREAEHPTEQIATQSDLLAARAALAQHRRKAEQAIRRALQTEITINFEERPLGEALQTLAERGEFPLWIDNHAVEEEAIRLSETVSARVMHVTIETALHRILRQFRLTFYIGDEVLKVTTWNKALQAVRAEVFPVGDLIRLAAEAHQKFDESSDGTVEAKLSGFGAPSGTTSDRAAWLVETIAQTTSLIDCVSEGRCDPMRVVGETLIVRADPHTLTKIGELLHAISDAAQGKLAHGSRTVRAPDYPWELDRQVYDALARKIDLEERNQPLVGLLDQLSERLRIPIILDAPSLAKAGLSAEQPITVNLRNVTLDSALSLLLQPLGLTFIVDYGTLVVTTGYNEPPTIVVYDIRDLTSAGIDGLSILSALELIKQYEEWEAIPFPGVLIIRKDDRGIREVERLLSDLRRNALAARPSARADDTSTTTRFYATFAGAPVNEVIEALTIFIKDQADPPPAEFTVHAVGSKVVIRTSNALHREIRRFLDDLLTPWEGGTYPGGGYF